MLQLGASAIHNINQQRRTNIKFDLLLRYRGLCAVPKKETSMLFGSNVGERIKDMSEVDRMCSKLTNKHPYKAAKYRPGSSSEQRRHNPYPRYQNPAQHQQQPGVKKNSGKKVSSNWCEFTKNAIACGTESTKNFSAGRLAQHADFWKTLTTDRVILNQVLGCQIEFENEPIQNEWPKPYYFAGEKSL